MFTNPPGDHAARLIEARGLKGFRIGDASVSAEAREFHHQSRQGERAADLERLIEHVRDTVERVHGVDAAPRSAHRGSAVSHAPAATTRAAARA